MKKLVLRFSIFFSAAIILTLGCSQHSLSQGTTEISTLGKIIRDDNQINDLIPPDAEIEVITTELNWCEGPLWIQDADDGYLVFSDIPINSINYC